MSQIRQEDCRLSSYEPQNGSVKQVCSGCKRRRMYFCYDCRTPLDGVFNPHVELPCNVDIVKHPGEKNSKSSALHCKIVAPEQTRVFDVPNLFDYHEEECTPETGFTVLVFPSKNSVSIDEFVRTRGRIKRFVVLDCTWFQVTMMQKLPQIQGLPCVSLRDYKTAFWRPQHNVNDSHLATIEAIYYALREYQELGLKRPYNGDFDDLLYWFFFTMDKVNAKKEEYTLKQQLTNAIEQKTEADEAGDAATTVEA